MTKEEQQKIADFHYQKAMKRRLDMQIKKSVMGIKPVPESFENSLSDVRVNHG